MLTRSHPLGLLGFASSMLAVTDPRSVAPIDRVRGVEPEGPTLEELVVSFVEVERVETTALLAVLVELVDDELPAARMRRALASRDHRLPRWLRSLAPLDVGRALEQSHVLGDGDNLMLDVRTAAGDPLTALVYIDHNVGTLVKDAFVVDEPVGVVLDEIFDAADGDPDSRLRDLDLAEARARITEAITTAAITYPPFETDTWPACRPLVEWVVRHLPEGGSGYVRPEWSEQDREALAARFFASPFGRDHDDADGRDLLDSILWFGCDYGPGDPLRWSPVAVEMLLADWLARKVIAPAEFLALAPDLLRSFVRFAHAERRIRKQLTDETLDAVDRWEPDYQATIRSPRPQGPAALMVAMGLLDEDEGSEWTLGFAGADPFEGLDPFAEYERMMRDGLRKEVGGEEALASLDAEPLPDEPFDRDAVPADVRGRVGEVLELVDRCCVELFDVEHRTACRRLLADVVAGDAEVFRRRGRADTAAAAIIWIVAKANDSFDSYGDGVSAKDLMGWFGRTGSPSQRANTLLKAVSRQDRSAYDMRLGTTRYLTSQRRRAIIDRRDRFATSLD
ncbi:MAG: DUF6398 domain-containing protein [Nitriliruptorales bacterium]